MDSGTVAIVSSLVTGALVGASSILSAWLSGRATVQAAEKKARAEFLSNRRQEWLDTIRDHLAEFMARANRLHAEQNKDAIANDPKGQDDVQRLALLRHKIDLMLSVHEEQHMELSRALEAAARAAIESDRRKYDKACAALTDAGRAVTKDAWEEAKRDIS